MTLALKYRTAGAWGAGLGRNLTKEELDQNFNDVQEQVNDLLQNTAQPLEIDVITVVGNKMTITLSDGITEFGPFTLPTAVFKWTGDFQPNHDYALWELFKANSGMYLVLQPHTSDATFLAGKTNANGPVYQLLFPLVTDYVFGLFFPGQPGTGISADAPIFGHVAVRAFSLPQALVGSQAALLAAATDDLSFPIRLNGTDIGSIDFAAYDTSGTFTFLTEQVLEIGNLFTVHRPAAIDPTAENLVVTFLGSTDLPVS